jgi:hypothetical protein
MGDAFLRRRVWRKVESLPDEKLYQVLDYIEFLDEKYGEEQPKADGMQKLAESVQDKLRARRVAPWALKGVMGALSVVDKAVGTAAKAARDLADEVSDLGKSEPKDASGSGSDDSSGGSDDGSDDRPKRTKIIVE